MAPPLWETDPQAFRKISEKWKQPRRPLTGECGLPAKVEELVTALLPSSVTTLKLRLNWRAAPLENRLKTR